MPNIFSILHFIAVGIDIVVYLAAMTTVAGVTGNKIVDVTWIVISIHRDF